MRELKHAARLIVNKMKATAGSLRGWPKGTDSGLESKPQEESTIKSKPAHNQASYT
jgi:hypothetical protein